MSARKKRAKESVKESKKKKISEEEETNSSEEEEEESSEEEESEEESEEEESSEEEEEKKPSSAKAKTSSKSSSKPTTPKKSEEKNISSPKKKTSSKIADEPIKSPKKTASPRKEPESPKKKKSNSRIDSPKKSDSTTPNKAKKSKSEESLQAELKREEEELEKAQSRLKEKEKKLEKLQKETKSSNGKKKDNSDDDNPPKKSPSRKSSEKTPKNSASTRTRSATADTSSVGKLESKVSSAKSKKKTPASAKSNSENDLDDKILILVEGVPLGNQKARLKSFPNAFVGKDAIDVLQKKMKGVARHDAIEAVQGMLERGAIVEANPKNKKGKDGKVKKEFRDEPKAFYRFNFPSAPAPTGKEKEIPLDSSLNLNMTKEWTSDPRAPGEVIESLFSDLTSLYKKYSKENGSIDWVKLRNSKELSRIHLRSTELQKVKLNSFVDKEQKRAFFVNLHNVIVLHSHAVLGNSPANLIQRKWVSDLCFYVVDELLFSSNFIETFILREGEKLIENDSRRKHVVGLKDPWHLLALSDGTKTTPLFAFYPLSPKGFDKIWQANVRHFLNSRVTVDNSSKSISLPFLLTRYAKELGGEEHEEVILQRVVPFLEKELADQIRVALKIKTQVVYDKKDTSDQYLFLDEK